MPMTSGDNGTGTLHFEKRRESAHGDSSLILYEATLDARVFAYLYLRSATCSLVWQGPQGFVFDTTLPFEFHDTQFSGLSRSRVMTNRRSVPDIGSSMLHRPKVRKCQATLFLAGEKGLREYDLTETKAKEKYRAEVEKDRDALARVAFGRYDFQTEYQDQLVSYSLTFEKLRGSAGEGWEFSVSLPRDLELRDVTLIWVARHHRLREMLEMDFEASLAALSEKIKPQNEQIRA